LENPETPLYHLFKEFGDVELVVAHRDQDGKGRTGSVMFVEKTGAANALKQPVKKLDDVRRSDPVSLWQFISMCTYASCCILVACREEMSSASPLRSLWQQLLMRIGKLLFNLAWG